VSSTHHLIAASRVKGQPVLSAGADRLGKIDDLMIDKASGRIAYALMSFDGFMGLDKRYYPVPWSLLDYDVAKHAYLTPLTRDQIEAGHHVGDEEVENEISWREGVHTYYGALPYW